MDSIELDEAITVIDSCLSQIKWRLKSSSKHRLQLDIIALITRMRPVIMIDYGGIMPQLQHQLSSLLQLAQNESPIFQHLRVMVIQEMIYLIHVTEITEFLDSSLDSKLVFADLEHESPKLITEIEKSQLGMQLVSIQKLFSTFFSSYGEAKLVDDANSSAHCSESSSTECIDLSYCMENTDILVPTLNGWLLGYPVVYLFGKDHIADAVYNLSTKYLHIFQVFVCSFSVPYDLSTRGSKEQWAEAFLAQMQAKWERCPNVWNSLKMEVSECNPQAIVL
ncbi:uncharacterized protein LOC131621753 isoform X2 [Vicia villosa]|uniref:uncharacterized protein LOC131621753 isoform X2 n=1 Tax=Vicia villosa TaxID=3911 RepID=UPI00273AB10B|nr:uncharacterized protein LOC131621753 isoform X2 [Vicia villosa]